MATVNTRPQRPKSVLPFELLNAVYQDNDISPHKPNSKTVRKVPFLILISGSARVSCPNRTVCLSAYSVWCVRSLMTAVLAWGKTRILCPTTDCAFKERWRRLNARVCVCVCVCVEMYSFPCCARGLAQLLLLVVRKEKRTACASNSIHCVCNIVDMFYLYY